MLNGREGPKRLTARFYTAAVLVSAVATDIFTSFLPINDISKGDDKFIRCTPAQKREIEAAAVAAQEYANTTYGSISSPVRCSGVLIKIYSFPRYLLAQSLWVALPLRFKTWFGEPSESRFSTVKSHFRALATNNFMSFTYYCSCKMSTVYAYVIPNQCVILSFSYQAELKRSHQKVLVSFISAVSFLPPELFRSDYDLDEFWAAPVTGTDSRVSSLLPLIFF